MIRKTVRVLIGLVGLLALLLALRLWIAPAAAGSTLGLSIQSPTGIATLRADVAGFFAGVGLFSLYAAVRGDRRALTVPLVLVGVALGGRLLTALLMGLSAQQYAPVAIEAALVVLFLAGRRGRVAVKPDGDRI